MEIIGKWISENLVALIALVLTPFLAWLFNRRTQTSSARKVDAEGTDLLVTSSGKLVDSWQEYAIEMKKEYNDAVNRNTIILATNQTLIAQNNTLIQQNSEVKEQNRLLSEQIQSLESRFNEYTAGIEKIFTLMLGEIEITNPDLARSVRDNFSELSKIVK